MRISMGMRVLMRQPKPTHTQKANITIDKINRIKYTFEKPILAKRPAENMPKTKCTRRESMSAAHFHVYTLNTLQIYTRPFACASSIPEYTKCIQRHGHAIGHSVACYLFNYYDLTNGTLISFYGHYLLHPKGIWRNCVVGQSVVRALSHLMWIWVCVSDAVGACTAHIYVRTILSLCTLRPRRISNSC